MNVIFLWQPNRDNTWKPTCVECCLYSNILWCVERKMMAIMWTRASVHSCMYPCHDWCAFTYKMKLSWLFSSICSHCVPFLMNSLKSNAAHCDTGPIKAGEGIREKLSRGHIHRLMVPYLFCLSRIVISPPRSSSSWQMCGWHIWVAKTRGVLPSCIKDK